MANENVKKFLEFLSTNKELQEKITTEQKNYIQARKSDAEFLEEIIFPLAKESDFEITISDFKDLKRDASAEESLNDDELQNISGGTETCFLTGDHGNTGFPCGMLGEYDITTPEGREKLKEEMEDIYTGR